MANFHKHWYGTLAQYNALATKDSNTLYHCSEGLIYKGSVLLATRRWGDLSGKPSTFAPSAHTHTKSQITDFPTTWAWASLTGVPSTFTPSAHTHDDRYYTETEVGKLFAGTTAITGYNKDNWDTVVTDFGNLEIGGRNYYLNTKTPFSVIGQDNPNQITANPLHLIVNSNLQNNGFVVGDTVTLSYKWKATKTGASFGSGYFYLRLYNGTTYFGLGGNVSVNDSSNSGVQNISFTLDTTRLLLKDFTPRLVNIPTDITLSFSELKLEKGNKATDWTPAPEDVEASIAAVQTNLNTHAALTNNPHSVTKEQVGLGNVENTKLSTWAGSGSITALGTVVSGTWSASTISVTKGGTGKTSVGKDKMLYASSANTYAEVTTTSFGRGILSAVSGTVVSGLHAATASILHTERKIWGRPFDGSADVSGAITKATTGSFSSNVTVGGYLTVGSTDGSYIQIGALRLVYDATNNAIKLLDPSATPKNANFYATGSVAAFGPGTVSGGGGSSYKRLDDWGDYADGITNDYVLSAQLGYGLYTRIVDLEENPPVSFGSATSSYVPLTVGSTTRNLSLSGHLHTIGNVTGLQTALNSKLETSVFNTHNNDGVRHITSSERTKWNTAYGWGNHASAGYLTAITKSQVTTALGFTPYDSTNPSGYTTNKGTVISVGLSVPTGLSVSGSPVTTSGTLTISMTSGYAIPTTAKQGQWDTAYTNNHTHSNKSVLDGITSGLVTNWDMAYTHSQSTSNPHGVTKAQVGLGSVNNTADSAKNVLSATKLTTARTIAGVSFNGTANIAIPFANLSSKPTTLSGYGITDAMGTSHAANSITSTNITNWNTAYGWGNHASAGYLTAITKSQVEAVLTGGITSHSHTFTSLTSKPTTLSGYGITDAMGTSHAANSITSTNITNWNLAYGWGNHASAGYIKSRSGIVALGSGVIDTRALIANNITTAGNANGFEYNIILNGFNKGITLSQSGTGQIGNLYGLIDGKLSPNYSSDGIDPSNPWVLLIEGLPNVHTQTGGVFGWTSRGWNPTRYKIEAFNAYQVNDWVVWLDRSSTASSQLAKDLIIPFAGTGGVGSGAFTKIRITIYASNGSLGPNGFPRWGLSEIYFIHPEASWTYANARAGWAEKLWTPRTINGVSFDGSANITIKANTPYTLTRGSYLTGSNFNGSANTTWAVDATSANTAGKVVARDSNGDFSCRTINAATGVYSLKVVTGGHNYASQTYGLGIGTDGSNSGIIFYNGTGATARIFRESNVLRFIRGGLSYSGFDINANGSITVQGDMTTRTSLVVGSTNGTYVQIGSARLVYDQTNNAIKVVNANNSSCNLYATGSISAFGIGSSGGSGTSYSRLDDWADYVDGLTNDYVLSAELGYDLHTRVNSLNSFRSGTSWGGTYTGITYLSIGGTSKSVSIPGHTHHFTTLTNKPTTLGGYGITDALPSTGGTLHNDVFNILELKRNSGLGASIKFSNNNEVLAKLGFDNGGSFIISRGTSPDGTTDMLYIHSHTRQITGYGGLKVSGNIEAGTSDGTYVRIGNSRFLYDSSTSGLMLLSVSGGWGALRAGSVFANNVELTSSRSMKKDIMPFKNGLDLIKSINVVSYLYKQDSDDDDRKIGFIADDTDSWLSGKSKTKYNIGNTVGALIKAVQELEKKNQELEQKLLSITNNN